ncbi:hypothetical protein CEXT_82141 [Caerostris extrusa]|uniref:Uncharacterized protein n=1 Tax=Caerostris extrusa TaxID=172846 RepID=A0AAV4QGS6_CAEEX|nr:hypothetical protein CEXT_82141 [Caerostris extrusa]
MPRNQSRSNLSRGHLCCVPKNSKLAFEISIWQIQLLKSASPIPFAVGTGEGNRHFGNKPACQRAASHLITKESMILDSKEPKPLLHFRKNLPPYDNKAGKNLLGHSFPIQTRKCLRTGTDKAFGF